ncbi:MAG: 30S ribosomal protein S3ae [Thermoplasmata archaeon]|nr:30S ribosomal protein S3ae [Thermoplasmata archaeon]
MAGASVASKKAKAAGGGRKVRDKWKAKEWYKIHAPRMFNEAEIGETPSADPEYVIGRTVEVTVQDLTGDFSKMHIKLRFKVTSVDGHDAKTEFIGHDLTSDYVRRLTRRKKTKTDHVVDVVTKDGFSYRIKTMAIADRRIQSSQEDAMRRVIGETLVNMGKEQTLSQLVKAIVSGDLAKDLARACRVVIPIKRIEIRKSEVRANGESEPESIMPEAVVEEAEEAAPAAEEPAEAPAEEPAAEPEAEAEAPAEE